MLFFRNSLCFIYRHSDLEVSCSNGTKTMHVNLAVACALWRVTRSDIGLHDLKHLRKGIVESMMSVLGRSGPRAVSLSPCFRGGVGGGGGGRGGWAGGPPVFASGKSFKSFSLVPLY